jgi:antitoxin component of RelBE/YafQ-DinJ toxin-antitoxin module
MARKEYIQIRLTEKEKEKLDAIAEEEGVSKSEIIRDHIKSLPDPREGKPTP